MDNQTLLLWVVSWSALASVISWVLRPAWQPVGVILCGAALLGILSPLALLLLGVGTVGTYAMTRGGSLSRRSLLLGLGVIVGVFVIFLIRARPSLPVAVRGIIPVGLAFFALRLIHYLFESFKGSLRPHGLLEYAHYHFLPSALAAGPIHRFDEFQRDARRRRWDAIVVSDGFARVLYGLVKIVVLANYALGIYATRALAEIGIEGSGLHAYLSMLMTWATLYLTFSGYSDIAIGFGRTMGLTLRENFRFPWLARNISDFWQRWHHSLSSWCRDYVYTPIAASTRRQRAAIMASMLVLGLWHEASLHYILWGAYHGAGIAAYRTFDEVAGARIERLSGWTAYGWRIVATLATLHFVVLSFYVTTLLQTLLEGMV